VMNGASNKRGRDDDDARPASRGLGGVDVDGLKRRKTIREGSVSGPPAYEPAPLNRARATITQRRRWPLAIWVKHLHILNRIRLYPAESDPLPPTVAQAYEHTNSPTPHSLKDKNFPCNFTIVLVSAETPTRHIVLLLTTSLWLWDFLRWARWAIKTADDITLCRKETGNDPQYHVMITTGISTIIHLQARKGWMGWIKTPIMNLGGWTAFESDLSRHTNVKFFFGFRELKYYYIDDEWWHFLFSPLLFDRKDG